MLFLTQLVRTPRDTGPRQRRKGGHYRTPFRRHLRTLNPYLLLLVLKTTGLNDSDFIVPKTINLQKLKKQKNSTNFLWGEDWTNQRRRRRKEEEGRKGGGSRRKWGHWIWIVCFRVCLKIRQLCWVAERSQGAKAIIILGSLHWQERNLKYKY